MLPIHPVCDIFPDMDAEDFAALKADIEANGVFDSVVLLDGKILDGKNRYRACYELGVHCPTKEWDGRGDPVIWSISKNLPRRHLTKGQRVALAVKLKEYFEEARKQVERQKAPIGARGKAPPPPPPGRKSAAKAAEIAGVSTRTVERAAAIKDAAPEKFREVVTDKKSAAAAEREIKQPAAADSGAPLDGLGRPIPLEFIWPIFNDKEIDSIQNMLSMVKSRIKKLAELPVSACIHIQSIEKALSDCWEALKMGKPYVQCPRCRHPFQKGCSTCKDRRWISKMMYDTSVPPEFKKQQEEAYRRAGAQAAG